MLMKILMSFIIIITTCYLSGCTTILKSVREHQFIYIKGNELVYAGSINEQGYTKLKNEYNQSLVRPTTLRISSSGGNEQFGILMGRWVYENKLNVKVIKKCHSSCANYIFPAGNTKFLGKNALISWHGSSYFDGAIQGNIRLITEKAIVELRRKGKKITQKEEEEIALSVKKQFGEYAPAIKKNLTQFYQLIKVNPMLPNYGYYQHSLNTEDKYKRFTYSLEGLGLMGLKNIVLLEGNWSPEFDDDTFIVAEKYIDSNFVH
jgi:hypothetical protein